METSITTSDGRSLAALTLGSGPALVVFEAGLGMSGWTWLPIMRELATQGRVVAYDRAGLGTSTSDAAPRRLERLASDLTCVIDAFPHERLVLVGHSWGGPVVRLVAAQRLARGERVDGLVLVDPADEHADLYFGRLVAWQSAVQAATLEPLARLGLLAPTVRRMLRGLPPEVLDAAVTASTTPAAARATTAEDRWIVPALRRLREHTLPLADLPVRLISGTRTSRWDAGTRAHLNAAHRASVAAHPGAAFVAATASGHLVPLSEPEIVVAAVADLLARPPAP